MLAREFPIAALIATKPSRSGLLQRALASLIRQRRKPDELIVVVDGSPSCFDLHKALRFDELMHQSVTLCNQRASGAAGAWNTGLLFLQRKQFSGYVAILDDDDEWDPDHLELCEVTHGDGAADVVLSGLRVVKDGVELPRLPLSSVARDDFLIGNPGWQGSNTFVRFETLMRAGGFTDGLPSTNDRDLAVRLLSLPDLNVAFTHQMTATWHVDSQGEALSRPGCPEKRDGLFMFLRMHGHLMAPDALNKFKARARDLFGIELS